MVSIRRSINPFTSHQYPEGDKSYDDLKGRKYYFVRFKTCLSATTKLLGKSKVFKKEFH